jgi:hypothetical protein
LWTLNLQDRSCETLEINPRRKNTPTVQDVLCCTGVPNKRQWVGTLSTQDLGDVLEEELVGFLAVLIPRA